MAIYGVSNQNGNDGNAGSIGSPKATIQAGIGLLSSAGDVLYIGPGTYREEITTRLTGDVGNPIKIIGDPDALVMTADFPGICRVTNTDANNEEQPASDGTRTHDFQATTNTEIYNLWFDGTGYRDTAPGTYGYLTYCYYNDPKFYNCGFQSAGYSCRGGQYYNCFASGGYITSYHGYWHNSVIAGAAYGLYTDTSHAFAKDCLFIGCYAG